MIAEAAPAVEEQRPLAFALLVGEVHVVEPPRWIHAAQLRGWLLLPIEPPEIDALLFQRMVQEVHVIGSVFPVCDVEGNVFPCGGINAHGLCHHWISVLPRLNAGRRMHIQACLQAVRVQPVEELRRIREEQLVPRVAGPSEAVIRLVGFTLRLQLFVLDVPIHVDHEDVERCVVLAKSANDLFNLLIAVGPVARPPRAECEARRKRNASRDAHIIAEGFMVVVSVAEEVQVLPITGGPLHHPRPRTVFTLKKTKVRRVE